MNTFFKYLDLPKIPEYLLVDIASIEQQKNIYGIELPFYKQFEVSNELYTFLKSIFDFEFSAQYQIIRKELPIHKDRSRTECINYLIDNGGANSSLMIYNEDKTTVVHREQIENFKWHWIDVSKFHGVSGLQDSPRFSITVTPTEKTY
jgi:hypothetical protein